MSPSEEKWWSAKDWSKKTNMPYRLILGAAEAGELEAVRPSGRPGGTILISESAWARWIERIQLKVTVPGRVGQSMKSSGKKLDELAI